MYMKAEKLPLDVRNFWNQRKEAILQAPTIAEIYRIGGVD